VKKFFGGKITLMQFLHLLPFVKKIALAEMSTFEAYTPYAIFRHRENNIEIEVVDKMLRRG
jgi:hypothetical protein